MHLRSISSCQGCAFRPHGSNRFPINRRRDVTAPGPYQATQGALPPRSVAELLSEDVPKFRQLPCRTFISVGTCPYRERCVYLHDPRLLSRDAKTKTRKKNKEDIVQDSLFWPVLPYHEVSKSLDGNQQPHVIQRYGVPCPVDDIYRRHDQAVYSMWMHFTAFCSLGSPSNCIDSNLELSTYSHPSYTHTSSRERSASVASPTPFTGMDCSPCSIDSSFNCNQSRRGTILNQETLLVNPFTNVNRLEIFKTLSHGLKPDKSDRMTPTAKITSGISCLDALNHCDSNSTSSSCSPQRQPSSSPATTPPREIFGRYTPAHFLEISADRDLEFSQAQQVVMERHASADTCTPFEDIRRNEWHRSDIMAADHPYMSRHVTPQTSSYDGRLSSQTERHIYMDTITDLEPGYRLLSGKALPFISQSHLAHPNEDQRYGDRVHGDACYNDERIQFNALAYDGLNAFLPVSSDSLEEADRPFLGPEWMYSTDFDSNLVSPISVHDLFGSSPEAHTANMRAKTREAAVKQLIASDFQSLYNTVAE